MVEDSVSSPFSHLPQFPELSAGPGNLFPRVLLASIVHRLSSHDPVSYSRRQAADDFNRSGDSRLGGHLRRLCREDWLKIDVRSVGLNAHMYTRGGRLIADPELCAAWDEVSVALYGPSGLLTRFRGSSAFGHGMLKENGLICLGALIEASGPATQQQLVAYTDPLMPKSSAIRSLNRLIQFGLVETSDGLLVVEPNWESTLADRCRSDDAGDRRQTRGRIQRRKEQKLNRDRLDWGDISDLEVVELRKFPCVQCGRRSEPGEVFQKEHFPPKSLFRRRKVLGYNHPLVLSAICRTCNSLMSGFVRSVSQADDQPPDPPPFEFHFGPPGSNQELPEDLNGFFARLFSASVDFRSRRFYEAFDQLKGHETHSDRTPRLTRRRGTRTRTISPKVARTKAARVAAALADLFKFIEVNDWLKKNQDPYRRWPPRVRFKRGSKRPSRASRLPY